MGRPSKLRIPRATNDELALLAHFGDSEAMQVLWGRFYELTLARARKFGAKYRHIDPEDLANNATLHFPKIVERYDPKFRNFDKYVTIALYRACQDELRKDDPLGIQIPQRSHYPMYTHLSVWDYLDSETFVTGIIEDGLKAIDRGYENVEYSDEWIDSGINRSPKRAKKVIPFDEGAH